MIESLESRLSRFLESSPEERRQALTLGIEVANFASSKGSLSRSRSVVLMARLLERASLLKDLVELPSEGEIGNVFRMALGAIALSPEAALAAANRRREEVNSMEGSVHRFGTPPAQDELPEDEGILALVEVEEMLAALRPLSAGVVDPELRLQMGVWFSLVERFGLGDDASDAVIRRWEGEGK